MDPFKAKLCTCIATQDAHLHSVEYHAAFATSSMAAPRSALAVQPLCMGPAQETLMCI